MSSGKEKGINVQEPDILDIDAKIRAKFEQEKKNLECSHEKLKELEQTLNHRLPARIKMEIQNNIKELKEQIGRIESNLDRDFYIAETGQILQEYTEILKVPIKMSFMGTAKIENPKKAELALAYLKIAEKYLDFKAVKPKPKKFVMTCNNCPNKKDFIIEESSYICPECGSEQDRAEYTVSHKDSDRVNVTSKYTYDRKVHFRDCINQYQGKQNCTIPQDVYDRLEDILDRHHLLIGNKNTPKNIRFQKVTKEHIMMFLKELELSKHYENVTLIHSSLTGVKPPDISHLEERLLADFDLLVETYDRIIKNNVDRVSFISSQYVLFQLLQRYKFPCRKEDFGILKTAERKLFHETVFREMAGELGWTFYSMF